MKQSSLVTKLTSVLLALFFVFTVFTSGLSFSASAQEHTDEYENMSSAQKQAYLEQKIKELNEKLASLGEQSKETEDYIDTLDEKIGFLQKELQLSKTAINNSNDKIADLEREYKQNEAEIETLSNDITDLSVKEKELQAEFDISYEEYSQRARALYISGGTSTLEMLLTCDDISTLFTRLEMIRQVSKKDNELLAGIQKEGDELLRTKGELEDKKALLSSNQEKLASNKENLKQTVKTLEIQQESYNEKEKGYEAQKEEADTLLLKLHNDTKNYSEFRNESLEDLKEINADIERAALEWQKRQEQLTTTTTTTTTTTATTSSQTHEDEASTAKPTTTKKPTTTTKRPTTASSKLQMIYPVPTQKRITCGWHGYAGHTGVDFACNANSKVVAAEDGEVIISKDVTSHSSCHCSNTGGGYHSYGRYIVIAHYKKNASGNYVYTLYAHNSTRLVSVGDKVKKGQLIAYSGSTGNSTGPHCHFEVRTPTASYDDCVNPTPYLP